MSISDYLEFEQVYMQTLGMGVRTIAVCASNSGEGVSTLACALAQRHQQSGFLTLLVDMNMFRPSLNQRFDLERVSWQAQATSFSKAVIQITPGLDVLTASEAPASGFRQINIIQAMLEQWLSHYDAVIIDTSPLNAINRHNIPAELLCACVQGTLLVVKTAITRQEELKEAVSRLQAFKVSIFGVVMNDIAFPTLQSEMQRETRRLEKYFPRLARKCSAWLNKRHLLNIRV